jgi:tRNA (guanine37-N1)-methyltransferase
MKIDILTIFPEMFTGFLNTSIIKRAIQGKYVNIEIHDIRKYSKDSHKRVDDYGFGPGRGMVLMPQPIFDAVDDLKS